MRSALLVFMTLGLLVGTAGCITTALAASAASLGAGWVLGAMTVPKTTEYMCYRNGVQIDCSELPQLVEEP